MVSVVMSVYNEELNMIVNAIDSMLNQTYQGEMEIIIVADNPDNKVMIDLLKEYENKYDSIILLINNVNKGLAYSLNRAIKYASGKYICRMDADDISFPERIETEFKYLEENKLDFVSSTAIPINDDGELIGDRISVPLTQKKISRIIKYTGCLIHPTWFFTKKSWTEIGGYREAMVASQDYDYSIRMVKSGYRLATIEDPLLYYRIRSNAISVSKRSLQTFLGLYAQGNVYRNSPFVSNINILIQEGKCVEYNNFSNVFNRFNENTHISGKMISLVKGMFKSRYFSRFVCNTIILRTMKVFSK